MCGWFRRLATWRSRQGHVPSRPALPRHRVSSCAHHSGGRRGQEPGGFTLRQLGIGGTSLPVGPWPNSHSRLPVIVRIDARGQLVAEEGHGRSVPTQVLSPLSNTPAWLFGSV